MTGAAPSDLPAGTVLTPAAFSAYCARGDVLTSKGGHPAVVAHTDADGRTLITKIWYRDRGVASIVRAYHRRFRHALGTLERLGVPVPRYRSHGRVRGAGVQFVVYEPLIGESLRGRGNALDLDRLAGFVAGLHARGVYFRGLHLGNVIERPDGSLGLIDVQDVRFSRRGLSWRRRIRNLGILCSHPRDWQDLGGGRWPALTMAYCRATGASVEQTARVRHRVGVQIQRRRARRAARRLRRGLGPLPE